MSEDYRKLAGIAHLARLRIDPEPAEQLVGEFEKILELVEQMNALDTTGVTPLAHPLDDSQRLRPDEVTEVDQRDAFQEHAPSVESGLYLVPRVIE